jgi:transcriptional regulator with XRE-family HTH domain
MQKNKLFIGSRLREERERLGLSQEELAAVGGVTKRTQHMWERGDQTPNGEVLSLAAAHGVDVLYVLTGRREAASVPSTDLSNDQQLNARGIYLVNELGRNEAELSPLGLMWLLNFEREQPASGRRAAFGHSLLVRVATYVPEHLRALNVQAVKLRPYGEKTYYQLLFYLDKTPPASPYTFEPVAGLEQRIYFDNSTGHTLPIRLMESESQTTPVLVFTPDEVKRLKAGDICRYVGE